MNKIITALITTVLLTSVTNAYAIHTDPTIPEMTINTTISDSMNCQGTLDNPITMDQAAACETQKNIELLTGVINYSQELQNRSNSSAGSGLVISSPEPYMSSTPEPARENQQTDPMVEEDEDEDEEDEDEEDENN